MADKSTLSIGESATPTVTTKKSAPSGKKKVIRRLVKNAKTGEIIKTEIVRIDSNGETTVTSYPAGTPVPSLGSLQSASRKSSQANSPTKKDPASPETRNRSDIGPSVPVNVPGLDDLLEKEKELFQSAKAVETASAVKSKDKSKNRDKAAVAGDESLETALISIVKKKRQRDPKARRRGLVASTMARRADSEDEDGEGKDLFAGDTDYRNISSNIDEEEENKRRKERHRRRREKKHREKPAAYRYPEPNDSGIDARNDQRPYDPEEEEQELHPLEEAELLAKQLQASAQIKHTEGEAEAPEAMDDAPAAMSDIPSPKEDKLQLSEISDENDDDKPKKKKKKHKNKKKRKKEKKQKRKDSEDEVSDMEKLSPDQDPKEEDFKREDIDKMKKLSRSRSRSFSSLSLSSISSKWSDSFDFAEVVPMPKILGNDFDNALGDYQRMRGLPRFRGRGGGYDMQFRGRGMFRGYPRGRGWPRGSFPRGRGRGFDMSGPGMFMDGGMMPMMDPMFMGRGGRGMWRGGPWGPMGRGGGFNNAEDGGIGIYVEDDSDSGRKRRSYSYSSYSSYSSRSRSRSRRRRRRHHSSSRSYSSYSSRSSRSYSRSYSRSSRSSRSYSRSSSRSYSRSRSRSHSKSRSRSRSKDAAGWGSSDGSRRGSPNFRDIYARGGNANGNKPDEEVPWWAEFDKTYEVQKKAEEEAKKREPEAEKPEEVSAKLEESSQEKEDAPAKVSNPMLNMTSDDIDVIRCVMSVVDNTCKQQDSILEDIRHCMTDLLDQVCLQVPDPSEEDEAEGIVKSCLNDIIDNVCSDAGETTSPPKKEKRLLFCYLKACEVTAELRMKQVAARMLQSAQNASGEGRDSNSEKDRSRRSDRKGRHGRRRRRSRSRRRRRHGRSYSRSSYSSSGSEKRPSLVDLSSQQQSLQQARDMLIIQQKQLEAAGILPASLEGLRVTSTDLSSLVPTSFANAPEPEILSNRWDKDLATKSKDDITRKLLQRMKEKKQQGDAGGLSPTFVAPTKGLDGVPAEKVFPGAGNLKSRKIAISSIDKSKVFGKSDGTSPNINDDTTGYRKSDIVAANAFMDIESSKDSEKSRDQEQRGKLEAWSDKQKNLKEEVKKMREEIEKAERANKERIKEKMLEEEKQREIMRIREEVREQIRKEIRDELEKQRKEVLKDPALKSTIMELEALKQSKIPKSEAGLGATMIKPIEESFVMQQDKHKEDMNKWLEMIGKRASDMGADEMRRMQVMYMQQLQHWSQQQQKAYMQWYWHQQQNYQQHSRPPPYNQQGNFYNPNPRNPNVMGMPAHSHPGAIPHNQGPTSAGQSERGPDFKQNRPEAGDTRFTHAPSNGAPQNTMEGTTRAMPPGGLMTPHSDERVRQNSNFPPNHPQYRPPPNRYNDRNMYGNFRPQDDNLPPNHPMHHQRPPGPHNQQMIPPPRFQPPQQHHQDMQRRPFPNQQDHNQAPVHQYPPPDLEPHRGEDRAPGTTPPPGMHPNQSGPPNFNQPGHPQIHQLGPPRMPQPGQQFDMPPMSRHSQMRMPPPHIVGNDQPPPPGVESSTMPPLRSNLAPPGVPLAPPGEEETPVPTSQAGEKQTKSSKKKKKKHRKHKRRRERSSSSDDDEKGARATIMAQLKALQEKEEGEVEDGEVQSDDENKPSANAITAAALLEQFESKKKKHKKKRKRRKRESSSEEEEENMHAKSAASALENPQNPPDLAPPPFFQKSMESPAMQQQLHPGMGHPFGSQHPGAIPGGMLSLNKPPDSNYPQSNIPGGIHNSRPLDGPALHQFPPPERSQFAPHIQQPPERYNIPPNSRGAGDPNMMGHPLSQQAIPPRSDHFMGPGGDHTPVPSLSERKRSPSPLPLVIPSDPQEMEAWARRMEQRYNDSKPAGSEEPPKALHSFNMRKVETIPSLIDQSYPSPGRGEPRHITSLGSMRGPRRDIHPEDDRMLPHHGRRKRERPGRGRGRKRRRMLQQRNYHDWDQPAADDSMVYYYSGSDKSSGWGSDKDFDDLLAKKKRETQPKQGSERDFAPQQIHVTNTRRSSPARRDPFPPWDKPGHMGEPQGIPVIGGSQQPPPQPIPSLANRGQPINRADPTRNQYDHMGHPILREDEFKVHQDMDYMKNSIPNEQQLMLGRPPHWDQHIGMPGGIAHDGLPPHVMGHNMMQHPPGASRPGDHARDRMESMLRRGHYGL